MDPWLRPSGCARVVLQLDSVSRNSGIFGEHDEAHAIGEGAGGVARNALRLRIARQRDD
jgi:hypothetical protein